MQFRLRSMTCSGLLLLLIAFGTKVHGQDQATTLESEREQLFVLQPMIGTWDGVGLQKLGGNARWGATTEWEWSFDDGHAMIHFSAEPGRYFSEGTIRTGTDPGAFILTAESPEQDKPTLFTGKWINEGLELVNAQAEPGQPARLLIKNLADNKRLVITVQRRSQSGHYQQTAVLGYTREGVVFATRQRPLHECVVTGGEGNQRVMHLGEEYWVCCKGCLSMFQADPEKVIAAYKVRVAKRQQQEKSSSLND